MDKILLVCPDLTMTDNLTFLLQHSGFQTVNVAGSMQALAEVNRSSPDLILMRENSHRLNGDELCIRIRELSDAPIIVLGQEQDEAAGVEFLEMGADAYLPTPLHYRELLARVRSLLRRTQASSRNMKENTQV
ncbi:MAG: response regulator transcription factor [Dehalococcoidia bacterium]|nr:response regulator transcription factor [Dehalococcoidia bacterium]